MKHLFMLGTVLLALSASGIRPVPALAQESTVDPAAYLSAQTSLYVEIHTGESDVAAFDSVLSHLVAALGVPDPSSFTLFGGVDSLALAVDFRADILPWLADSFAVAAATPPDATNLGSGLTFVFPIADPAGAQAFVDQMNARTIERDLLPDGSVFFYGGLFSMAVSDSAIWLGSPDSVKPVLPGPAGTLAQNAAYQQVRAALPADALVTGYLSGAAISEAVGAQQAALRALDPSAAPNDDFPDPAVLLEAAFRLHPAQSAAQDALLQFPALNGIGFAVATAAASAGGVANRLNLTAALSLDARYPALALASATAGAALLDLLPPDSFVVFDSYDVSLLALPTAGLALLGPTVGNVFTNIVASLDGTPPPTPTPTPTPTPAPPLTADAIIAQVQPFIARAESLMGMSLDELYSRTSGEYAIAVFPGAGPTIGAALYLHSADPQRLIDTLDHVSKLILIDPVNGTPLVAVERQTVDGVDVALLGVSGAGDRPALGILNGNVLFLTMESAVSKVIASASSPSAQSPALAWRDTFGASQEALFYVDPRTIDLYALGRQRFPALPTTAIAGSFDVRDDGLFVLNLAITLADT